ncbi:MAG: MFS transporter [Opitutaceae bacterium]|jgi:OPA family glycerol-3-phosphate transporter-like MFS transporter/OPA family sugar phosphate sensor protein UhpC-like MFS transporter|nr:MFS transporter [Opitutaceae bacterium]
MFSGKKSFAYWQWRTILGTMFGYALFYFIRKNISVAMPFMEADLGVSKAQLGIFLTLHGVVYGFSKLGNGILGDRSNARVFMVSGLLLAAACNIVFGLSSSLLVFGLVWILNGWFQGMGFPPCARLITHWVPPNELATKMAVWNASHSIGAALVVVLCGYVAAHLGMDNTGVASWRWCFLIPSAIAIAGALALWLVIRDTPSSVGLPELPGTHASNRECGDLSEKRPSVSQIPNLKSQIPPPSAPTPSPDDFKAFLRKNVFLNPVVWLAGVAMFFV